RCRIRIQKNFVFFVTFCKGFLQIIYEAAWRRTYRSFFAANSFFPHGFCAPICPRRVCGSREWPALVAYAVAGRDLHGPRADGSDALQSPRRLVARSAQSAHRHASPARFEIGGPYFADFKFRWICFRNGGDQSTDVDARAGCSGRDFFLFAHEAVHERDSLLSPTGAGNWAARRLDCENRPSRPLPACAWGGRDLLGR